MKNRIKIVFSALILAVFVLCIRLFKVSVIDIDKYAVTAHTQRSQGVVLDDERSIIYDRNMIPLTNTDLRPYIVLVKEQCTDIPKFEEITGVKVSEDNIQIFPLDSEQTDLKQLLSLDGVSITNSFARYNKYSVLSHLVGYYHDEDNCSGIEKALNKYLEKNKSNKISVFTDARGNIIPGLGLDTPVQNDLGGIKLSIDYHVQKICESVMDEHIDKGAAIVVDASNGDILSMVSRPDFDQTDIASYLNSSDSELVNRAIQNYDIGSVFKIVILSRALDKGLVTKDSKFVCHGKTVIAGKEYYCHNLNGHNEETLSEAFAYSCNIPFYEIGQALGISEIVEQAKNFGFGEKVLNIMDEEAAGVIPSKENNLPGEIANISIGQGKLLVTPLQIASMMYTILNNGTKTNLNLIKGVVGSNGTDIHPFEEQQNSEEKNIISMSSARVIKKMMQEVIEYGTGKGAALEKVKLAGKTSSAETGWQENGEFLTHGWFAGFFPADTPKYICVIFAENGKSGSNSAVPAFSSIAEKLHQIYN